MLKRTLGFAAVVSLLGGLVACSTSVETDSPQLSLSEQADTASTPTESAETSESGDLTQLFSRIWQITDAPSQPPSGSIYIFLANGTLLQTSCTETYRIATWTIDKDSPQMLQVVEDGTLAFTARIEELSDTTLRLQKNLVRTNETQDVTLTATQQEFVCPDLPR